MRLCKIQINTYNYVTFESMIDSNQIYEEYIQIINYPFTMYILNLFCRGKAFKWKSLCKINHVRAFLHNTQRSISSHIYFNV